MTTVIGLFENLESALKAYRRLQHRGYSEDVISILGRYEVICGPDDREVATAAVAGGTSGAVIGALAGTVIGLTAITVPGIGVVAVSGGLGTVLASIAAGAGIGGAGGSLLLSELIKRDIPRDEAALYQEGLDCGSVLVSVEAKANEIPEIYEVFEENHAVNIDFLKELMNSKWQRFKREIDPNEGNYQHIENPRSHT